jgi:hypothetical protein
MVRENKWFERIGRTVDLQQKWCEFPVRLNEKAL